MPLPIVPLALGATALFVLSRSGGSQYSQAPADGSKPPKKEPAPPAKTWQDMPPALQEQVAAALGALGVSPATGELSGSGVTAQAIQMATQTAALCESQGFYDVASQLRKYISQAAPKVATPAAAAPLKAAAPPGLSPAQIEAVVRTLTLDRDPKSIQALLTMLEKLPASPERDHYVEMTRALLLQIAAAQSTTQTMQQIDQVIKSPGIAEVHAAVQPLPAAAIPLPAPAPRSPPAVVSPGPSAARLPTVAPAVLPGVSTPANKPAVAPLRFADIADPAPKAALLYHGMPNAKQPGILAQTKSWQSILKKFGYSLGKTGPGKDGVDGDFGGLTTTATLAFQKQGQLNVDPSIVADGKVGPQTRRLVAYRTRLSAAVVSGSVRARRYRRSA